MIDPNSSTYTTESLRSAFNTKAESLRIGDFTDAVAHAALRGGALSGRESAARYGTARPKPRRGRAAVPHRCVTVGAHQFHDVGQVLGRQLGAQLLELGPVHRGLYGKQWGEADIPGAQGGVVLAYRGR